MGPRFCEQCLGVRRKRGRQRCEESRQTRRTTSRASWLHNMDVDMDEKKEEFDFSAIAVSSSAGWHEPKFM